MIPQLPHAGSMHWLDDAVLSEEGKVVTAVRHITDGHPFVKNGYFPASGLIELMAQTAAAGAIMKAQLEGKKLRHGVLAAVRELRVLHPVAVGNTVTLTAIEEKTFGTFTSAHLSACIGAIVVAHARMTFHLQFE